MRDTLAMYSMYHCQSAIVRSLNDKNDKKHVTMMSILATRNKYVTVK